MNRVAVSVKSAITRFRFCMLVVLVSGWSSDALAQKSEETDSIPTYQLDEIVVTGSRVSGEILTVPMAVGVVGVRDIAATRRVSLGEALAAMPGVVAQSRSGSTDVRLTVRGFGARGNGNRSNSGTSRGIKVLLDGFPETEPDGRTSFDLIDPAAASRIEVFRTNASTLFGNASGGVLRVDTRWSYGDPQATLQTLGGSFGLFKTRLSGGAGINGHSVSVSGSHTSFPGWRENSEARNTNLQIKYRSLLSEKLTFKVLGQLAENNFEIPGPLTREEYDARPEQANATYAARRERRSNRVGKFGLVVSRSESVHNFEVMLYYNPKLLQRSERGTFRDFSRYHIGGGATYEWRPESGAWKPSLLVGIDEAYQDGTILFYTLESGERGDSLRTNKREGANSLGTFFQVSVNPLPSLYLQFGGRWDWQAYISEIYPAGLQKNTARDDLRMRHFTPRAAILYRYAESHSVYLSVGGGVEAPAFNEVDPPPTLPGVDLNPFLKPMTSETVELGAKGISAVRGVQPLRSFSYSLAAYRIRVYDEIVPYDGGSWYFSAGESRRIGLEGSVGLDFINDLSFRGVFTLMNAEYVSYENDVGDFSGKEVPGIPPAAASIRVSYRPQIGLTGQIEMVYRDSYFADDANSAVVPGYVQWNASIGYSGVFGPIEVGAIIGLQNIADRRYAASAFINPAYVQNSSGALVPSYLEPGLPRNMFAGIDVTLTP